MVAIKFGFDEALPILLPCESHPFFLTHPLLTNCCPATVIIIIIIIIIIINCKWVFTRWQWYNNKTTDK
jgi:hypothetical protein